MRYLIDGTYYNGDEYSTYADSIEELGNLLKELSALDTSYCWQNADDLDAGEVIDTGTLIIKTEQET